jgi:hypothetical protein
MGLLTRLAPGTANTKVGDEVHLLHGLMVMAAADGVLEESEWNTLRAYWSTLPEFKNQNFETVMGQVQKVINRFGNVRESINSLAEIQSDAVRKKLFVLAADLAMSSGDVDANEDQMLDSLQRVLNISDSLATQVLQVLSMKYAR